jgi:hypothetical protein
MEVIEHPAAAIRKTEKALVTARENTRERSTDNLLATYDKLFEDFQRRNEMFVDRQAAKGFDYTKLVK